MKMTDYARATEIETRSICLKSIKRLEEDVARIKRDAACTIQGLRVRIGECRLTVIDITNELKRGSTNG